MFSLIVSHYNVTSRFFSKTAWVSRERDLNSSLLRHWFYGCDMLEFNVEIKIPEDWTVDRVIFLIA